MTTSIYTQLQKAYDFFNKELFDGSLPKCFITVQRDKCNVLGYFSPKRFGYNDSEEKRIDEIAINPLYFINGCFENVLSTLVHEMVHLEQAHFGDPGRARYHNRQWGQWMERVGLIPSDTGIVGGKRTGDKMTHYIAKDGKFDKVCQKLKKQGFKLDLYDRHVFVLPEFLRRYAIKPINYGQEPEFEALKNQKQTVAGESLKKSLIAPVGTGKLPILITPPSGNKNKRTYQCETCKTKVWGKPDLKIICGECEEEFKEV